MNYYELMHKLYDMGVAIRVSTEQIEPRHFDALKETMKNILDVDESKADLDYTKDYRKCKKMLQQIWQEQGFRPDASDDRLKPFIPSTPLESLQKGAKKRADYVVSAVSGLTAKGAHQAEKGAMKVGALAYGALGTAATYASSVAQGVIEDTANRAAEAAKEKAKTEAARIFNEYLGIDISERIGAKKRPSSKA